MGEPLWFSLLVAVMASEVIARSHSSDLLGANFILPSLVSHVDLELERQEPVILESVCENRRYAGYDVDEAAFREFVRNSEPSCEAAVEARQHDWKPETTRYLHALWRVNRLLAPMKRPGGPSLEESPDYFEHDLIETSQSVQKVLDSMQKVPKEKLSKLIHDALGRDIAELDHPSREAAQEILNRIKSNFNFYHGDKCLVKSHNGKACGDGVQRLGTSFCQGDETNHMCSFAENYQCSQCGASFRFPRYRSIPKLLETKLGRCGEFSDVALGVFTHLGYEARLVVDHTDHVWVEVNLPSGEVAKFTHADPSEGVLDNPFLYQDNWKKQLTFVFAHTPEAVEDRDTVYWHADDHAAIVHRRGMSDAALEEKVFDANMQLQRRRSAHLPAGEGRLEEADDDDATPGERSARHHHRPAPVDDETFTDGGKSEDASDTAAEAVVEQARGSVAVMSLETLVDELDVTTALLESRLGSV